MDLFSQIQQAVAFIRPRCASCLPTPPLTGIVLGSGLGAFSERLKPVVEIPYGDIPHFPISRVPGHAGKLMLGFVDQIPCAVMSGRVHYYEGYDMERVTFPVRVLAALGIHRLIVTNAAGAVNPTFTPGDFMVMVDHINLTGANPLHGPNDERLGPRFPDMSQAYGPKGRKAWHEASRKIGLTLREGVYVGLAGPSYETPAEIRMLQTMGADAVGMSTVAEVIVAAHAGLEIAGLSVVTNRAAGLSQTPLSHEEVKEVGNRVRKVLCDLLAAMVNTFT